jgi:secondary thiamine-phosphate synthase enzyme
LASRRIKKWLRTGHAIAYCAVMRQATGEIFVDTIGPGLVEVTANVRSWVKAQQMTTGLVSLLCRHTSASLTIQENAANAVRDDIVRWLGWIAPEDAPYDHYDEGPDDMPAHIKAMLTGVTLSIPVRAGVPALGTWQGIFLIEHRRIGQRRRIALHLMGA